MAMREIGPVTTVTVKSSVPVEYFKELRSIADERGIEVGALLLERAQAEPNKPNETKPQPLPRSDYNSVTAAQMLRLRQMNRSVSEIANQYGFSRPKVQRWLLRAEGELRGRLLGRDVA